MSQGGAARLRTNNTAHGENVQPEHRQGWREWQPWRLGKAAASNEIDKVIARFDGGCWARQSGNKADIIGHGEEQKCRGRGQRREEDAARVRHKGAPSRNHDRYMKRGVCESERQEA